MLGDLAFAQSDSRLPPGPPGSTSINSDIFQRNQQRAAQQDVIAEQARKEAFDAAIQGLLPLRPEEIRTLLEKFDQTQESVETPVYPNPTPEVAVQSISLDPGAKPAVVKVAFGHVTTLSILDASGQPWPIEDLGWAGDFEVVETAAEAGSHILRISPQSEFAFGNISLRLIELSTPVIITMETSREIVHYRFDAVIPQYGPNGSAPIIDRGITIAAGSPDLSSILQGLPPSNAERLDVTGADARTSAFKVNKSTFLRTPHTLLSPAWNASVSSADGTNVYELNETPIVLLSDNGKMIRARLSPREDIYDDGQ